MIGIFGTGGTISGRLSADGTYSAASGAEALVEVLGESLKHRVRAADLVTKLSFEITLDEWLAVVEVLRDAMTDDGVDGLLVTQGTALLEEVPYLASLFLEPAKPLVFTGAMKPLAYPGSDARANLLDALTVASDPQAGAYGALVVMGGRVVLADAVHKAHRTLPSAVEALGAGLVGEVDGRGVDWLRPPPAAGRAYRTVALARDVPLIKAALGVETLRTFVAPGRSPDGIVLEGFPGGGGIPARLAEDLAKLAGSIPVLLSSRSASGRIIPSAGGASGGGALLGKGFIAAGRLTPVRARLRLMAALANRADGQSALEAARDAFAGTA